MTIIETGLQNVMKAPSPLYENQRLEALRRYAILDTTPDAAFERLTALAAQVFETPIAVIDLLDETRQWFKSSHGFPSGSVSGDMDFCAHAILEGEVLVVPDARLDPRFADNPLVTGATGLRFYAGAPLRTPDGFSVGVLAIMDRAPRTLSVAERATLMDLAALVVDEMELRLASRDISACKDSEAELQKARDQLQVVLDTIPGSVAWIDADLRYHGVNRYLAEAFSQSMESFIGQPIGFMNISSQYSERVRAFMAGDEERTSFEFTLNHDARARTFLMIARKYAAGRAVFVGTDITQRKVAETALQKAHDELEARVEERTRELADVIAALRVRERELRTLAENAPDIICRFDRELRHVFVSPAIERLLGLLPADFVGKTHRETTLPPELIKKLEARLRHVFATGEPHVMEYNVSDASGRVLHFESRATPELDENGRIESVLTVAQDITERKQAEDELNRFFSVSIDMLCIAGFDGYFKRLNAAWENTLGYSREELEATPFLDFVHPEDKQITRDETMKLVSGRDTVGFENRYRCKDGSYKWLRWQVTAVKENQLLYAVAHDITTRKQAEETLRESERGFRQLVDQAADGLFVSDRSGRFINVNQRACDNLGYSRQELLGIGVLDIQTIATPELLEESWRKLLAGETITAEGAHRRKDGTTFPVDVRGVVIDWDGEKSLFSVVRDITARKQVEEALRESEALKTAILETAIDCIITIDHQGKVLEWNPAAEETFGFSRAEMTGQVLAKFILPESLQASHNGDIPHYLTNGEGPVLGQRSEVPLRRKDGGEILVELAIHAIPATNPPIFTAYLRDITERKQFDEALQAAKTEAERANRAKSEFLSRMSHELRTPLNAILGFGQLLEMDDLNTEQRQGVEQILNGGRHLLGLINEVLDIARIESEQQPLDIEPVPVAFALRGAMEMIRPLAASRGIELRSDWDAAEGLYVLADHRRLNQVLLNLLANAIKYNRDGGTATLSSAPISDGASAEIGRLRIAVSDSGAGIAAENLSQLFTPFERLGAETSGIEGTGLGLALSKRLVEAMDGTISVQSTIGQGSSFAIEMPLSSEPISPAPSALAEIEIAPLFIAGETHSVVLYIEDNLSNFGLVQNILRHRSEIKLLAGVQGQSGIDLAIRHRPDLILLDFHLPDMSGDEVLWRLREEPQTREIPVIIVSADATPPQIERMLAAGAVAYLTKPLDVRHFLGVVEETLRKSRS